jgi:hypothetical protein
MHVQQTMLSLIHPFAKINLTQGPLLKLVLPASRAGYPELPVD